MHTLQRGLILGLLLVALGACSGDRDARRDRDRDRETAGQQDAGEGSSTGTAAWGSTGEATSLPESGPAGSAGESAAAGSRIVYFEFDSSAVGSQYSDLIAAEARRLTSNRALSVRLEGHTDERGGREYNLALGQKRAEAVRRSLSILGVKDEQLEAVSFGKEKPAAQGASEDSHARNRRVEFQLR